MMKDTHKANFWIKNHSFIILVIILLLGVILYFVIAEFVFLIVFIAALVLGQYELKRREKEQMVEDLVAEACIQLEKGEIEIETPESLIKKVKAGEVELDDPEKLIKKLEREIKSAKKKKK